MFLVIKYRFWVFWFWLKSVLLRSPFKKVTSDYALLEEVILGYLTKTSTEARKMHLQYYFSRDGSPYTGAVLRAGGLLKAVELVVGSLDAPLKPEFAKNFATPTEPSPLVKEAFLSLFPMLRLWDIYPPDGFLIQPLTKHTDIVHE